MHNKQYKKAIVFALCLTMLMPLGSMAVSSTSDDAKGTANTATTAAADEEKDTETDENSAAASDDEEVKPITDEEALKLCEKVNENDKLALYLDEENQRLCLYVKESGKYWWTSPINVQADQTIVDQDKGNTMKTAIRKSVSATAAIKVADLRQEKRTESPAPVPSTKAKVTWEKDDKGVCASYRYSSEGVSFKVHYELDEDNLYVYCDTKEIEEDNTSTFDGMVLTKLQLCPYFGAAPATDIDGNPIEGYMIVPDGSGAVIKYNNGKTNYAEYNQQVYGRDYTTVLLEEPKVTQQAYLPVMASVSGSSGIVSVVSDGDSNVYAKAQVSGQNKQAYNNCYFEFETRSSDSFFMSGDNSNKITVFEKNGIKTDRFGVRFYAVEGKDGADVNYADCAEVYRNYLKKYKDFNSTAEANKNNLYLDFYGGVLKQTSIAGFPFDLKKEVTGFSQAKDIIGQLKDKGVDSVTANYNDWTNNSIKNKISTDMSPSGTLGGKSDFKDLIATDGASVYPSINNFQMESGSSGYFTLTSTAIRVSNAYSRQSKYSLAFGVAEKGVAPALLSPNKYSQVFSEMIESYKDEGINNIAFGDYSTKLVSDFSNKNPSSRNKTMETVANGYKDAKENIGSVLADGANAYVLPYVSEITNVPVYSTGFNITDYDIPFYQMVVHGSVSYSTTPLNASSNSDEAFLLALASGSQIHYDMTYADADLIQDTDYNDLYYTHYSGWMDAAANQYKAAKEVLSGVSDYKISKYELSDDNNVITTTYSKDGADDVKIVVDKSKGSVSVDGKAVDVSDCIEGGSKTNE